MFKLTGKIGMKTFKRILLAIVLISFASNSALANTYTWSGSGGNESWGNNNNWSPYGTPSSNWVVNGTTVSIADNRSTQTTGAIDLYDLNFINSNNVTKGTLSLYGNMRVRHYNRLATPSVVPSFNSFYSGNIDLRGFTLQVGADTAVDSTGYVSRFNANVSSSIGNGKLVFSKQPGNGYLVVNGQIKSLYPHPTPSTITIGQSDRRINIEYKGGNSYWGNVNIFGDFSITGGSGAIQFGSAGNFTLNGNMSISNQNTTVYNGAAVSNVLSTINGNVSITAGALINGNATRGIINGNISLTNATFINGWRTNANGQINGNINIGADTYFDNGSNGTGIIGSATEVRTITITGGRLTNVPLGSNSRGIIYANITQTGGHFFNGASNDQVDSISAINAKILSSATTLSNISIINLMCPQNMYQLAC